MLNDKKAGIVVSFLFFSLLITFDSFGQNSSNYIQYLQNTAISFNLNSTTTLENGQSITDAFCLGIKAAANSAHYYVHATESSSSSTPMPVSNLELLFYSTGSGTYSSLNTSVIPLSGTDQLLFIQAKKNSPYNFCYTVEIPAIGYSYAPGTYTFTLTFTMTEP